MSGQAELLRAAASLMRSQAEAATPGPWRVSPGLSGCNWVEGGDYDEIIAPAPVSCMSYCYGGSSQVEIADTDAAHIASWHPAVALAVADWLDGVAARAEAKTARGGGESAVWSHEKHAVAVAGAYMGQTP